MSKRPNPWPYVLVHVGGVIVLLAVAAIVILSNVEVP